MSCATVRESAFPASGNVPRATAVILRVRTGYPSERTGESSLRRTLLPDKSTPRSAKSLRDSLGPGVRFAPQLRGSWSLSIQSCLRLGALLDSSPARVEWRHEE